MNAMVQFYPIYYLQKPETLEYAPFMKKIDLSEWYAIAGNSDNIAIGKQLIDAAKIALENGTEDERELLENLLLYYCEPEFEEAVGIIGFAINNSEEVSVSAAVISNLARHQLNRQLCPLSWAGIAMQECELKLRIQNALERIDSIVESK